MTSKHTPGPWQAVNGTDVFTRLGARNAAGVKAAANDGWYIADCDRGPSSTEEGGEADIPYVEKRANARLIAAAPELLQELEYARTTLSLLRTNVARSAKVDHRWEGMDENFAEWLGRIDSAIAKATGEQP